MDSSALVIDLNNQVYAAQHAYYVLAEPIMSDADYDVLEARLRATIVANPELSSLATSLNGVGSDIEKTAHSFINVAAATVLMGDGTNKNVEGIESGDSVVTLGGTSVVLGRILHERPMLSIENQYTKEDVVKFFNKLPPSTACLVEAKRDCISCECAYLNGKLTQAVTRGTGTEGEDMTAQVKALQSVPQFLASAALLDMASDIRVRGEMVMRDGELDRINAEATATGQKTYLSTRNLTAGTLKQKDLSVVSQRDIIFIPWDLYSPSNDDNLPDSAYERMKLLETAGFPKYLGVKVTTESEVTPAIDAILDQNSKSDVRADGVVIKVDSHKVRHKLGVESKYTNWTTCFKLQSASGTTYLRNIIWQIGRQGALTPVAECDPVVLAGAVVTRATLNNETWIATMGLKLGAKVEMLRSGDVIPQITKVLDATGSTPIVLPDRCPECAVLVTVWTDPKSGVTSRFCDNGLCPGRICGLFSYIGGRDILEIDGLADDMATRLIKGEFARNIGELFEFQVEMMAALAQLQAKHGEVEGEAKFLSAAAKMGFSVTLLKMLRSMETAKTAPWNKWLSAFGIPMVGRTLGKLLAKELKLESDDLPNLCSKLEIAAKSSIEGLGQVKSDLLRNWALDPVNRSICEALYRSGVRPSPTVVKAAGGQPLTGVYFCVTGEFDFVDREELATKLESLGAVAKSSVSKNCSLLICGNSCGKSKLHKAETLGIKIVKEDWVIQTFTKYGLQFKSTVA